jgi:hypothetical protein
MAAQIDEVVLDSFRVDEDDFRDMDSIVRQHCETVKYYVYIKGAQGGYDTDNVARLLKERNGIETRIMSVRLHATGAEGLRFNVEFDDTVRINAECDDRYRLVLLTTETRAVIKDRMKGRTPKRQVILQAVAVIFFILGYFGFQQFQSNYANRFDAEQLSQSNRLTAPYLRELKAATPSSQELLAQAVNALSKKNLNAEISFLVGQQIAQLQQQVITNKESQVAKPYSSLPSWASSFWLTVAAAGATAAMAVGIGYLTLPSSQSVFLIGDEKYKQERADKRRENIKWSVIAAFVVSLATGIILLHA